MKEYYVKDVLQMGYDAAVDISGWIASKREHGLVLFLDLVDSTGDIQVVVKKDVNPAAYAYAQHLKAESSVRITGILKHRALPQHPELEAVSIRMIGDASLDLFPRPRTEFDIFSPEFADLTLKSRHLYLRNKKLMAVLRIRHSLFAILHGWFRQQGFIEIHGPILAQVPLYEDRTAFALDFFGYQVFLNQCVAFYLESAVHAFEKVYNIGPSFRAEESKSRRHLAEYWHVKAEVAFADYEDILGLTENMMKNVIRELAERSGDDLKTLGVTINVAQLGLTPYPRLGYAEALEILRRREMNPTSGQSLSASELECLAEPFSSPFWITGIPRAIEPFPYMIDPADATLTKTADLIAPEGYGELLGIAEKISDPDQLLERMKEKGRESDTRFNWYCELRRYGSVPHSGFGMGVERLIRWLTKRNHVRDTIPFPRLINRSPYP
jgi:asparaginyl-tRNA synthetase